MSNRMIPEQPRAVTKADLADIHALNETSMPAVSGISRAAFDWFLAWAAYFRLVEIDGALAGFLLALEPGTVYKSVNYAWFQERYSDFYYIDRLAVDAAYRRRGVASALYADVERRARGVNAARLACEVNVRPYNAESLAFHAHQGFAEVAQQDTDNGRKRVSLMIKALPRGVYA